MKRALTVMGLTCVCAGAALAQHESKVPKPSPEHKRLAYFVGNWTSEGEMKKSPFGPGGNFTTTDRNELFPGGFFIVLHSNGKSPMGPVNELAVLGYNAEEKVYTYDGFDNMGQHEVSKGTVEGNTWTWNGESKIQGKTIKGRFIIKELSPTMYTFKYDYSTDSSTWTNGMEGKAIKTK